MGKLIKAYFTYNSLSNLQVFIIDFREITRKWYLIMFIFLYFRSWRTLSSKLNQLGEILHICKRGKHRRMAEKNIGCWPLKGRPSLVLRWPFRPAKGHSRPPAFLAGLHCTPPAFMAGLDVGCRPWAGFLLFASPRLPLHIY